MPRILFDARWIRPGMTGVGTVADKMLSAIGACGSKGCGAIVDPLIPDGAFPKGFAIHRTPIRLEHHPKTEFFEQFGIPALCRREGYQAFVSFEARVPLLRGNLKAFAYIHDLAFAKFTQGHGLAYQLFLAGNSRLAATKADRIITVSEAVKSEIKEHFGLQDNRVLVIPNAGSGLEGRKESTVPGVVPPFFLSVGMNNPRKNLEGLLKAFKAYRALDSRFTLALTGDRRFIEAAIAREGAGGVVNLGFITEEEMAYLYRNAHALVFPSHYEGFGIPLVDAASFGLPVLCSDIPVFREVMGGYATYFPPGSPEEMAARMSEQAGKERRIPSGRTPKVFDWGESAKKLLEEIGRVVEGSD